MTNKKILLTIALLPLFLIAFTSSVSAGLDWKGLMALDHFMKQADSYDVVWDGPSQGDKLFVSLHKDKPSPLSNVDLNKVDYLNYERYDSSNYQTSNRYTPNYWGRQSNYQPYNYQRTGSSNYANNNYERLTVDNTISNINKYANERYLSDKGYWDWRY
ncbi:MAG: hypothetical protein ABIG28_00660 [archaeon]